MSVVHNTDQKLIENMNENQKNTEWTKKAAVCNILTFSILHCFSRIHNERRIQLNERELFVSEQQQQLGTIL